MNRNLSPQFRYFHGSGHPFQPGDTVEARRAGVFGGREPKAYASMSSEDVTPDDAIQMAGGYAKAGLGFAGIEQPRLFHDIHEVEPKGTPEHHKAFVESKGRHVPSIATDEAGFRVKGIGGYVDHQGRSIGTI